MQRELPMFQSASSEPHGAHMPPTIAMGGPATGFAATAGQRHPEWIRARLPSGENYTDLKEGDVIETFEEREIARV